MEDSGNEFQSSKKRAAGVQLSRDNPGLDEDEETSEQEGGTFKRASDEVLASRRIVKVRRQPDSAPPTASNPFSIVSFGNPFTESVTPLVVEAITRKETEQINQSDELKTKSVVEEDKTDEVVGQTTIKSVIEKVAVGEKSEEGKRANIATEEKGNEKEKAKEEKTSTEEKAKEEKTVTASFSSFQQLSSGQNAFSGFSGTGSSTSAFSFDSIPKYGSTTGSQQGFGFGFSKNGNSSLFGAAGVGSQNEGSKFPSMSEVPQETGEENENAVFAANSVLFEYVDKLWKERGKGELKVNVSTTGMGKARLVMWARGNYRLILNSSLFPDMKLTDMDKKGVTFACVNSAAEGKNGFSTFALKFKDASIAEEFKASVMEHKAKASVPKTPENSPKATEK